MKKRTLVVISALTLLSSGLIITACANNSEQQDDKKDEKVEVTGVTLDQTSARIVRGQKITLVHTIAPANATNKNVTWTSSNDDIAMVSGGVVRAINVGTATITVKTEDGNKTATCSIEVYEQDTHVAVSEVKLAEDENEITLDIFDTFQLHASVLPENATTKDLVWTSSDETVAFVDGFGKVKGIAVGECDIVATSKDNANAKATCHLTVVDPLPPETPIAVEGIAFEEDEVELTLHQDASKLLNVVFTPGNATNKKLSWSSSNEAVATIFNGLLVPVAEGETTITAISEDGGHIATCHVTVTEVKKVAVTSVVLDEDSEEFELDLNETAQLVWSVLPEDAENKAVKFVSNNEEVVVVSSTGRLTALAVGSTTVDVISIDNESIKATASVTVVDVDSKQLRIDGFTKPKFLRDFEGRTNKLDSIENLEETGKTLDQNTFFENEEGGADIYRVGHLNGFKFNPTAESIDENLDTKTIANPYTILEFALWNEEGETYIPMTEGAVAEYVSVNAKHNIFNFTSKAIGNKFKLTTTIDASKYKRVNPNVNSSFDFEFEVIDGYNAYEAEDISVFDNTSFYDGDNHWAERKRESGLLEYGDVNGLVLHNDLAIRSDWLPEEFKYTEEEVEAMSTNASFEAWVTEMSHNKPGFDAEAGKEMMVGSMKDYCTVFRRVTTEFSNFRFEGNYCEIDFSNVKQVADINGYIAENTYLDGNHSRNFWNDGSHSQLFGFNDYVTIGGEGEVLFSNANIKGNGNYSADVVYMGGLITFKIDSTSFTGKNLISSNSFITYMPTMDHNSVKGAETRFALNRSKNYNSYNSAFYMFGTEDNVIENTVAEKAGGALFLMDEVRADYIHDPEGKTPKVSSYNVFYENYVSPQTTWFAVHNASALISAFSYVGSQLGFLGLNAAQAGVQDPTSITTVIDGVANLNMIAIDVNGRDALGNPIMDGPNGDGDYSRGLTGEFKIYDEVGDEDYIAALDMNRANAEHLTSSALYPYMAAARAYNAPGIIFESNKGSAAMVSSQNEGGVPSEGATFIPELAALDAAGKLDPFITYLAGQADQSSQAAAYVLGQVKANNYFATLSPNTQLGNVSPLKIVDLALTQYFALNGGEYKPHSARLATADYVSTYLQPLDPTKHYLGCIFKAE